MQPLDLVHLTRVPVFRHLAAGADGLAQQQEIRFGDLSGLFHVDILHDDRNGRSKQQNHSDFVSLDDFMLIR